MQGRIQKIPVPPPPPPRVWTSLDLINWTKDYFLRKGIEQPRVEAELLLSGLLGVPRIKLYVDFEKPVAADKLATYREYVKRRAENREPLQYILGHSEFIDLKLKVTPAVLIPRPETEQLALWAIDRAKEIAGETFQGTDLCTGSGCLALYLAHKEPRAKVTATDLSAEALAIAKENAAAHQLEPRVTFAQGDLFAALPAELRGQLDLIVTNPPYVDPAGKATLQPEVVNHEPHTALFGGDKGLAIITRLINDAPAWLKPGAWLGLEFGIDQSAAVRALAEATNAFAEIKIESDFAKIPRLLFARKTA